MQLHDLREIIERASELAGTQRALAQAVGVTPNKITDYKTGLVGCPPETVALIADAANLDAKEWLAEAVLWRTEGTPQGERLRRALKKQPGETGGERPTGHGEGGPCSTMCIASIYRGGFSDRNKCGRESGGNLSRRGLGFATWPEYRP